jgi:hypothetical protein
MDFEEWEKLALNGSKRGRSVYNSSCWQAK